MSYFPISYSMFSNPQPQNKCIICQELIDFRKNIFFSHEKIDNRLCYANYCMWCCYDKITNNNTSNPDTSSVYLNCCNIFHYGIFGKMSKFIDLHCIICGNTCKSKRVNIYKNGKLHAGK